MWVRRASIVALIPLVRKGAALDLAYDTAATLHEDEEDLIQKAVGWTLREAGKADMGRLERYLREQAAKIPRTTLRYAIERFPTTKRRELLAATRFSVHKMCASFVGRRLGRVSPAGVKSPPDVFQYEKTD